MHILFIFFITTHCYGQIINEISPYPLLGIPEWIELHNSSKDTISLYGMTIEDNTTKQMIGDIEIPVNGFIILTKDTLSLKQVFPYPSDIRFIQTPLPVLNNTKDKLLIMANHGHMIDSITYTFQKVNRGKSLERCFRNNNDSLIISSNPIGHTGGLINSCNPLINDARLIGIHQLKDSISIVYENNGDSILYDISLSVRSHQQNTTLDIDSLSSFMKDTVSLSMNELLLDYGEDSIKVSIQHRKYDPRSYNDSMNSILYRSYPYGSIRINEVNIKNTYYPEYVELKVIDSIYVGRTPLYIIINNDTLIINDSVICEYNVITSKSIQTIDSTALFKLEPRLRIQDQAGKILIVDRNGTYLDSLYYGPIVDKYASYPNYSIEYSDHIDEKWFISTDINGGTPGRKNSPIIKSTTNTLHISADCIIRISNCQVYTIKHPFYIGSYSCDAYSISGLFIKNILKELLLPSNGKVQIPDDAELIDQLLILLHTVKDIQGTTILHALTPIIMRN